jgi:hypothetical protein
MKWKGVDPHARLRVGTIAILLVGFASAIAIYLAALPPPGNPLGYEPGDTKTFVRDMEVYGGKGNLLAYEFRQWFASLWHGKPLAFTTAAITVIVAGVFAFFAAPLPPDPEAAGVTSSSSRGHPGRSGEGRGP